MACRNETRLLTGALCTDRNVSAITESARTSKEPPESSAWGQPGCQPSVAKIRNRVQDASLEDLPLAGHLAEESDLQACNNRCSGMCSFCDIS
jgi:hypothetical protein